MPFLFYRHDLFGLGHIRRTTVIAERLLRKFPAPSALVVTGSPRAHYFRYPPHCDYLKLPSVSKGPGGRYICREIEMSIADTVTLRGRPIRAAADSFHPDVFFPDTTPPGLGGITGGGGGDGNLLMSSFLEGYERLGARPPFEALLITGPLMSPRKRKRFLAWADRLEGPPSWNTSRTFPGYATPRISWSPWE